jgi:hypothetical protein
MQSIPSACTGNCGAEKSETQTLMQAVVDRDPSRTLFNIMLDNDPVAAAVHAATKSFKARCEANVAAYEHACSEAQRARAAAIAAIDSPLARAHYAALIAEAAVSVQSTAEELTAGGGIDAVNAAIEQYNTAATARQSAFENASDEEKSQFEAQMAVLDANYQAEASWAMKIMSDEGDAADAELNAAYEVAQAL